MGQNIIFFICFRYQSCIWRQINGIERYSYHLFTETEGNSVFCRPETAVVASVEGPYTLLSRGLRKEVFCYIVHTVSVKV
jgi:hypothetical protein